MVRVREGKLHQRLRPSVLTAGACSRKEVSGQYPGAADSSTEKEVIDVSDGAAGHRAYTPVHARQAAASAAARYISVAGPPPGEGVANYSLVAELVESPIVSQYIPLDAAQAAQEKCGRFCVVLTSIGLIDEYGGDDLQLRSAADALRGGGAAALALLLLTTASALTLLAQSRR